MSEESARKNKRDHNSHSELQAINERLLIASVEQQELAEMASQYAERAQQAEERAEEALTRLNEVHKDLLVTHARLGAAFERERQITEALQRPLTLEVPENAFPGLSAAALYEAALEEAQVGGDFSDVFALPRELVAVAISDASGKGLSAAVRTLQLKDVLRAFTREYPYTPAGIVARLNDFLCDNERFDLKAYGEGCFSCLSLAILDPKRGEGSLVSAGCEPALIVRADGTTEVLGVGGPPLGIEREVLYIAVPFHLSPGDTLVLVTDGITEARRGNVFLHYEGMRALAKEALAQKGATVRAAAEHILRGARSFGGGSLRDDACVVLVRRD